MKKMTYTAIAALFLTLSAGSIASEELKTTVIKSGDNPSFVGPEDYFTGQANVDMLFKPADDISASAAYVTFEAGARSAWHTHPAGQRLIVTKGTGLTQEWGGPVQVIHEGDVVVCPPGVKHWHGASPDSAMTHIAITGDKDGKNVTWMEKVSDEQYNAK